jgi:SAM-dependent methyltransferase
MPAVTHPFSGATAGPRRPGLGWLASVLASVRTRLRGMTWAARNLATDLRFGGSLAGSIASRHRTAGASDVVNSQYSVLPHIFAGRIEPNDVLVDVGCGKGRVINWWLSQGLSNRIVGIELDADVAAATARRLRKFPNVTIVNADATTAVPDDATLLYLYSPFGAEAMERLKRNLAARFAGRRIQLLYWNPEFVDVFEDDPHWTTQLHELTEVRDPRLAGTHRRYAEIRLA